MISVDFPYMDIEDSEDCNYDFLKVSQHNTYSRVPSRLPLAGQIQQTTQTTN